VIQGVIKSLDHKYLNELKPFDVLNPSAENIARHIYDETAKQLRQTANGAVVASITVWESDVTAATYRP
jgi:6-pyruvoyltetrahydropterin/6-carboxytetrahydropterin synthase